jgi:hypothetical protein
MTEKIIMWSHVPFQYLDKKAKWADNEDEEFVSEYEESDDYGDLMDALPAKMGTLLQTPFGLFNIDDKLNPFRRLEFWEASTNFDITNKVKILIETTPGIEILNILTRYRFLVAIGRAFDFRTVRLELQQRVCGIKVESLKINKEVEKLKDELADYKDYAIYIFPNGRLDWAALELDESNKNDYLSKIDIFNKSCELSNGKIVYKGSNDT